MISFPMILAIFAVGVGVILYLDERKHNKEIERKVELIVTYEIRIRLCENICTETALFQEADIPEEIFQMLKERERKYGHERPS